MQINETMETRIRLFLPMNDDFESYVFLKENGSLLSPDARAHVLKVIMPDEVSRFFLFDGELLQEYEELLLEGTEVGSKIKDSIETILGVPVLTNSAIDSQSILDDYRKEKNKIAQSNAQTQKIATQMEGLEAEKREQTADLERLQGELAGEYEERARLEGDLQQSEHVKTLLDRMDSLEADIAGKKASRDALVSQIARHLLHTLNIIVVESFTTPHHYCPMSVQPLPALTVTLYQRLRLYRPCLRFRFTSDSRSG